MSPVVADFSLTFDEFAEAYRTQRRRKQPGIREPSPWIGCAVLAALFFLLAIGLVIAIQITGKPVLTPGGKTVMESTSPVATFLVNCLPWPMIAGLVWLAIGRARFERRVLRRSLVFFLLLGFSVALINAVAQSQEPPQPPQPSSRAWLWLIPLAVTLIGGFFIMRDVVRRSIRVAWEGQPQLQQHLHAEATLDQFIVQTPHARLQYAWSAFTSFSETDNLFVLSLSAFSFHTIPKRAFPDPAAPHIDAFRALIQSRVRNDNVAIQGFPVMTSRQEGT